MPSKTLILVILAMLAIRTESGALIPRSNTAPQPSFMDKFWDQMGSVMTGALHLIGSIVPLRGLATIAKDIGIPGADYAMDALTPVQSRPRPISVAKDRIDRRSDNFGYDGPGPDTILDDEEYTSYREEMSSVVGTMMGDKKCMKKLACLGGRRLASIDGGSSVALLASTASSLLPEGIQETLRDPLSAMRDSIMYSNGCHQYEC
jgi:hypothetical protein